MRFLLICVVLAMGCKDTKAQEELERAKLQLAVAEQRANEAYKEAMEAREKVDRFEKDLEEMGKKLDDAINTLTSAQNDADRTSAMTKLEALRKEKAEMEARIKEAKAKAAAAQRVKGSTISPECQQNPLAKGCS